ncbi:MAG: electron transfer flavoprotein subunit beta/FixA family protein [Actinobacteria bacterium]|nr:electron transfer flavoprotein subunit beta/FixA family protein [Actinomycetota bacterium]
MRVLVCVKRVPAPGAKINITADGQAVDTAYLAFTTSPHEECAVEEAVRLIEAHGGESTALTLGPGDAEEQLRYAASIGVDKCVLLPIDSDGSTGGDWDPQRTSDAITTAIQGIEAADGAFDLILFGNESADSGNFQVGIRVAHGLSRPMVNGIKGIELGNGGVRARRESETGVEVYVLPLPAVLGVKEGINLPRYPTLKGRLASKKVALHVVCPSGVVGGQQMITLVQTAEKASTTVVLGHGPDAAPAVVDLLEELGLLK